MNALRLSALAGVLLPLALAPAAPAARVSPTLDQLRVASRWIAERQGEVAWAVVDSRGRMHSRDGARPYRSASMSKAMLLVAALRRYPDRQVPRALDRMLRPMIVVSGNRAGSFVHRWVGDAGLLEVARAARMRHLVTKGTWSEVRITAADMARLFVRIDRLVPRRHRDYARTLLERIHPRQQWGFARTLRPHGWDVRFKGGWRRKLVHQAALVERGGRRVAIAVLSDRNPTHEYGRGTIAGFARRLLGDVHGVRRAPVRRTPRSGR